MRIRLVSAVLLAATAASALVVTPAVAAPSDRGPASLAFAEPREFATGAIPSADVFNRAAGDQLAFQISRSYVADGIVAGDFNEDADGNLDVVQSSVLAGTLSVFVGDGRGGFSKPTLINAATNPNFVVARDLDHDGHLDLAVADVGANSAVILRGDGRGGFAISQVIPVPAPRNVAVGDFNGDDVVDLAVASRESMAPAGGVTILTGAADEHGAVTFAPAQFVASTKGGQPVGTNVVAVGDFDDSGNDDLAIGVGTSPSSGDMAPGAIEPTGDDLLVFLNRNATGDPFDTAASQRFRVGATPNDIAVEDWNNDGHPDLAVLSPQSGDITTLLGDSAGHFSVKDRNTTVGALPRSLKVGDFDNDGIADLATASFAAGTVSVLPGEGDGRFAPAEEFWVGDAPTSVDVGRFDDDKRLDIVTARMQPERMALLLNESPKPADGVLVTRDVAYVAPDPTDQYAAHHTLDVFAPPAGTRSFAGSGKPYPVFVFAHGGAALTGDKSMLSYLMRSLARRGIVAVTIDYRLTSASDVDSQAGDYANAFGWLRANVSKFGGNPNAIVIGGTSAGSAAASLFATSKTFAALQPHIRGIVHVGTSPGAPSDAASAATLRPTLAIDGDTGAVEIACAASGAALTTVVHARRANAKFVVVPGRDHLTVVSNLARGNDRGRDALLHFLQRVVG